MTLPTGTVTFLFTDIEGSTRLLQALGHERYGHLQDEHSAIMRDAIDQGRGVEIRTEGDAFFAVFGSPAGAVLGGIGFSRMLRGEAAAAVEPFEQAIEIQRAVGDRFGVSQNLVGLAGMRLMLGETDTARALVREATEVATALVHGETQGARSSTNASLLSTVLLPNAIVASFDGRHEDAARLLGGWERLEREFLLRFPDVAIARFGDPAVAAGKRWVTRPTSASSPTGSSWTSKGSRRW